MVTSDGKLQWVSVLCTLGFFPYGKKGELPTSLPMGCTWATEWAARGLPMRILPCKLGCPLLPYMKTVGSSVGSLLLLPNMKKVSSSVGSRVGCPLAAHGNFAIKIRLPTTSIYGNSGQLSRQRSGLPMGILPCKLGCPLLPYTDTVGS